MGTHIFQEPIYSKKASSLTLTRGKGPTLGGKKYEGFKRKIRYQEVIIASVSMVVVAT
jgi:hypothetical protein